jgi:hypothetical protein
MPEPTTCAICGAGGEGEQAPAARPLVAREFFEQGIFAIDPLGTAGASVPLCAECAGLVGGTMLHATDLEELRRAIELHGAAFPPNGPLEERGARIRLWHRALHLGLRALVGELSERPAAAPARPEPDQLGLFVSKTARLSKVEAALREGDLPAAIERAQEVVQRFDLPEGRYLAARLVPVAAQVAAAAADPEQLAQLAQAPERLVEPSRASVSLASAFGRGLHRLTAKAAERRAPGTAVGSMPAGWHWMMADEPEVAELSLEASVASGVLVGPSLVLLGNLAFEQGEASAARERYRKAYCLDPEKASSVEPVDPSVAELIDDVLEFELEPPAEWLPMVGYLRGVFTLHPEAQGQGGCREFHQALLSSRRGDLAGGRRRMRELAPLLFEELREEGKL